MYLLQAWKESLALFLPRNFSPFFWATFKLFIETIKAWVLKFWWLPILFFVLVFGRSKLAYLTIFGLIIATLLIAVVPSILRKTWSYYFSFKWHILWIFVTFFAMGFGVNSQTSFLPFIVRVLLFPLIVITFDSSEFELFTLWMSPIFIFFIFFLLDTRATIMDGAKSLANALKAIVNNYPFLMITVCLFLALGLINAQIFHALFFSISGSASHFNRVLSPLLSLAHMVMPLVIYVFYLCFTYNFYIKEIQESH